MNIFKALSEGNGRISETNVTSFISYLLDSTNELNNSFFILFAKLIDENLNRNKLCDLLGITQKTIREQVLFFSNNYIVSSEPEYFIKKSDGSKKIPDILLRIKSKPAKEDTDEIAAYIIIENKINKGAIKKGQVEKQFDYFLESEEYQKGKPVYSVLITPDENIFSKLYMQAVGKNENTVWLKWTNHKNTDISIEAILKQLLRYEQNAEIEPINPNTQFILKSFIDYIATEFSFSKGGKKNYSYKGFKVISSAYTTVNGKEYYIKRFSNNMIRLFDKDDNLMEIEVRPVLREINEKNRLGINLFHSTGVEKNTQILGKEIINKLKEIKSNTFLNS